jgi:hypothetical protein
MMNVPADDWGVTLAGTPFERAINQIISINSEYFRD